MHGKNESVLFSVADLKCENLINPLGIDNTSPHFSWKLKGDGGSKGKLTMRFRCLRIVCRWQMIRQTCGIPEK